jgi:hypothetical protein
LQTIIVVNKVQDAVKRMKAKQAEAKLAEAKLAEGAAAGQEGQAGQEGEVEAEEPGSQRTPERYTESEEF